MMRSFLLMIVVMLGTLGGLLYWAQLPRSPHEAFMVNACEAPSEAPEALKLISYNIAYGRGFKDDVGDLRTRSTIERNLDGIASLLKDSDIAFLQEVDFASKRSHDIDEVISLADKSGLSCYACVTTWVKNYVPYPPLMPGQYYGHMKSGQCILSRYPILSNERISLPQRSNKPFWYLAFSLDRAIQVAELMVGTRTLRAFNVHLEAFDTHNRMEQGRLLAEALQGERPEGLIVAGDFNAIPSGATVTKTPEAPQHESWDVTGDHTMQLFLQEAPKLQEAIPFAEQAFTFPADAPTHRIDYLFFSPDLRRLDGGVVDAGMLSDHKPIFVEVGLHER